MRKVLVTGGTGFIGRHSLSVLLEHGWKVHALTIDSPILEHRHLLWHQVDLMNYPQVARVIADVRPEALLHFAWYAVPHKYWTSMENLSWVSASINLFREFAGQGGKRMVAAGTCAEYDWSYGFCSENVTPCKPTSLYGISKRATQQVLSASAKEIGLSFAWGRIFFLYGPYEHPERLVAYVIRSLLKGEIAKVSSGNQVRDFLHVSDVGNAFVALLESEVQGAVNISSGRPVALRELILEIARLQGNQDLVQFNAAQMQSGEPPLLVGDSRRLQDEVGWKPRYNLEEGLGQTISWWKGHLEVCR